MKSLKIRSFVLAAVAALVLAPGSAVQGSAAAQDYMPILTKMEQAGRKLTSLQAGITLEKYDSIIDETDTSSGTLYYKAGSEGKEKVLIEYTEPVPQSVSVDGDEVVIYQPRIKQAFVTTRKGSAQRNTSLGFLSLGYKDAGNQLRNSYDVTLIGPDTVAGKKATVLKLKPKAESTMTSMTVWVDDQTGLPLQYSIFGKDKSKTTVTFSGMKPNAKIDDGKFKISYGPGTDIVKG